MEKHENSKLQLNILYALAQAGYWMMYCAALSYPSVYLLNRGYTNTQIGILLAIGNTLTLISQPVLGKFADRTQKVSLAKILLSLYFVLALVFGSLAVLSEKGLLVSIAMATCIVFAITAQPITNALCNRMSNDKVKVDFGIGRSVGSFAYAGVSLLIGNFSVKYGPNIIPVVGFVVSVLVMVLMIIIAVSVDTMPKKSIDTKNQKKGSITEFIKKYKWFVIYIICTGFFYLSHAFINNYYFQIVEHIGGDSADLGRVLSFSAVWELPAMFFFTKLEKKSGLKPLLAFAGIMFFVKGLLTMLSVNVVMLLVVTVTQGLSFAVYIPASVALADRCMEEKDRVTGQSLITTVNSFVFLGSSLFGGMIIDNFGVTSMQLIGVIAAAAGSLAAIFIVRKLDV